MDHDLPLTAVWNDRAIRTAADQMALDDAMLTLAVGGLHCLRLYRWSEDTVSLGANESAVRTWDRARLEADGVAVVRRPTGGRAVWHARDDLTYAWSGPASALHGARAAYATLHQRLADALAPLRLAPTLAMRPTHFPGLSPGACFDVPVGGEVLVGGRKAIGSAQLVRQGALLQHGAIARSDRRASLDQYRLTPVAAAESSAAPLPDADTLANRIAEAWCSAGARLVDGELTSAAQVMTLQTVQRYRDPLWTWRR